MNFVDLFREKMEGTFGFNRFVVVRQNVVSFLAQRFGTNRVQLGTFILSISVSHTVIQSAFRVVICEPVSCIVVELSTWTRLERLGCS